jgi:hypothetical protein
MIRIGFQKLPPAPVALVPVAESARMIVAEIPVDPRTHLANVLSRFILRRFHIDIPATAWDETQLPDHLRMRIILTEAQGMIIKSGRLNPEKNKIKAGRFVPFERKPMHLAHTLGPESSHEKRQAMKFFFWWYLLLFQKVFRLL